MEWYKRNFPACKTAVYICQKRSLPCRNLIYQSSSVSFSLVRKIPTTKSDFFRYRIHTMFYYNKLNKQERLNTV